MLKDLKDKEKKLINLKVTEEEFAALMANAKKFTASPKRPEGNLSLWLRYAGTHHTPPASALTKPKIKKKR